MMNRIAMGASCLFFMVCVIEPAAAPGGYAGLGGVMPGATAGLGPDSGEVGYGENLAPFSFGWRQRIDRSYELLRASSDAAGRRKRGAKEANLYQKVAPSVVLIEEADSYGSGFIVSREKFELKRSKKEIKKSLAKELAKKECEVVHVVTNWHVVDQDGQLYVRYKPEEARESGVFNGPYPARVLRVDEKKDLAILAIVHEPSKLRPLKVSRSQELRVGDDVYAIGHPLGENWTFTRGIVSQIREDYQFMGGHVADVIQTQTPINPGNSGGPLLNDSGSVIGVNSFGRTESQGLNYAVTSGEIQSFLDQAKLEKPTIEGRDCRLPVVEVSSVAGVGCERRLLGSDRASDQPAYVGYWDTDCDGLIDTQAVVPDDEREPVTYLVDRDGDGRIDASYFDSDRDGCPETSLFDQDGDGEADMRGFHRDCNGVPYHFELIK